MFGPGAKATLERRRQVPLSGTTHREAHERGGKPAVAACGTGMAKHIDMLEICNKTRCSKQRRRPQGLMTSDSQASYAVDVASASSVERRSSARMSASNTRSSNADA